MSKVRLERETPAGREFFEAEWVDGHVVARGGLVGGEPIEQRRPFNATSVALEAIQSMVARRVADGWQHVASQLTIRDAALEAAIRAATSADERRAAELVYADWLTERGNPQGELIARYADDPTAAADWRNAHHDALFGPIASSLGYALGVRPRWDGPWLERLKICCAMTGPLDPDALRLLLAMPVASQLRRLDVDPRAVGELVPLLIGLADAAPPLRRLRLAPPHFHGRYPSGRDLPGTARLLSEGMARLPTLEALEVYVTETRLASAPRLRELGVFVEGTPEGRDLAAQLQTLDFPALEELQLVFRDIAIEPLVAGLRERYPDLRIDLRGIERPARTAPASPGDDDERYDAIME